MDIEITTLSENTASYGFLGEWGLSILVSVDGTRVLVDTGLSFSAVHNARVRGTELAGIDRIVLSHGHADHTGGLVGVLAETGGVEVIAHPDVFAEKCARRDEETVREIGIPFSREELEALGARFTLTREPVRITDRILTTGEVPMLTGYEEVDRHLCVKENGEVRPDPLADDLSLVIDADYGLVVILGCAHRGVVNTLHRARSITGRDSVYAVIGGTHLVGASEERLERTVADLKGMGVQKLGVSHCTGFYSSARLAREFGDVFFLNNAGSRFTLP